ncbi:Tam3-transposase (Ac family) protein [Dioscorea alata]|uniref:Tam3-transposase (Ac family) protein n=2 Tax=Dioscorea alata TaxID=55571 RepID=A0ACB7TUZ3_DIOAL|nr:Tam3-transposase (Ac family) protein [Dioscorea alata]KAH7650981.1 Tam3-transposase (Ac family) protein [Dioscorea alata]
MMDVSLLPNVDSIEFGIGSSEKGNTLTTGKPRKKSMTSLYLKFFETAPDGKSRRCKFCKQSYAMSTATGNLGRHLNHHHPGYDRQSDTSEQVAGAIVPFKKPPTQVKPATVDFDHLNWLLLKWLIEASLPPSSLDEMLNRSFKFLNPLVKFWPKEKVQAVILEVFRSMREDIKASLEQINSKVSITLDFWTSCEQLYYMCVKCHWIDENWYPHKVLLDVCHIPYPFTGPEIFQVLIKVLKMYNIDNRVLSCTHDNSQHAVHACRMLSEELDAQKAPFCYIPCAARTLNLIIEDGLRTPKPILSKIREFVIQLNSSAEIAQDFKQIAVTYQEGLWKLPLDASASWSGDYTMLDIVCKASNSMDTAIRKHEETFGSRHLLSSTEKSVINLLHSYFEPFYKITTNLCASKVQSIGLVLFFMDHVFEVIGACRDSCRNEWLKSAADDMATRTRSFNNHAYNSFTFMAAVLDPRIKRELIPESLNSEKNLEEARDHFSRHYSPNQFPCITNTYTGRDTEEVGVSFAEEIARKRRRASMIAATDELTQYLTEPLVPIASDVLDWWRVNATRYPRLSVMARDYLAVQGTSVEPEELFSSKGDDIRKQQFSLPHMSMQPLMCIKSWLHCGYKFKYRGSLIDFDKLTEASVSANEIAGTIVEKKQK